VKKEKRKALALGGFHDGAPCEIDVNEGKVIWVRAKQYDLKYTKDD
jgi:hypothetical protein